MTRVLVLIGLVFGGSGSGIAVADDALGMTLDKTSVGFGLPVTVKLSMRNRGEKLPDADLSAFRNDFIVRNIERSRYSIMETGRRVTIHETGFRLYARHPGSFRLPSIQWGTKQTQAVTINVLPQDPNGPEIKLDVSADKVVPRLREPVTVEIKLVADQNLTAEPEAFHSADFFIQKLPTTRQRETRDTSVRHVTRFSWLVMPLKPGLQKLQLPLLALGGRRLLPGGVVSFNVEPLADYIPTFVPVGSVRLETERLMTAAWLEEPLNWKIRVYGQGLSGEGIARLLSDSLRNTESIRFYPAKYALDEGKSDPSHPDSLRVSVPLVPLQSGSLRLPEVNIPYVDPESGHLNHARLPPTTIRIRNPLHVGLLIGGFVLAGLALLVWITRKGRRYLQLRHRKQKARRAVDAAETPDALARALLIWTDAGSQAKCQTLTRWSKIVRKENRSTEIARLIQKLERWRWKQAGNKQEFDTLKLQFLSELK